MNGDSPQQEYHGRHAKIMPSNVDQSGPEAKSQPKKSVGQSASLVEQVDSPSSGGMAKGPHSANDKRRLSHRLRSALAVIATVLALAFAYLAVAVSAHWFPWHQPQPKPRLPSMTAVFTRGALPNSVWNAHVYRLMNFLSREYTKVVRLDLTFNAKGYHYNIFTPKRLDTSTQFLYVKFGKSTAGKVIVAATGPTDTGQILDLEILQGPGSALGYASRSAVRLDISGYFQIGASPVEAAGYFIFNLIPVQPPS